MDIWDSPESPSVTATLELPGLKKEEISLLIQDGSLVIWGERRSRLASGGATPSNDFPVQEVKYGKFRRVIPLPQGAQVSQSYRRNRKIDSWGFCRVVKYPHRSQTACLRSHGLGIPPQLQRRYPRNNQLGDNRGIICAA
jgi:Hsp20/alpha crystallin family